MVQNLSDEDTYPAPATVLTFLNKGVEEVCRRTGSPRLFASYPTITEQTTVQLNNDVLAVVSANFSIGANQSGQITTSSPFAQGSLVYPMTQIDQASFMDAAAGFPAVGFGPPQAYLIYQDQGYAPGNPLPIPSAPTLALTNGTSSGETDEVVLTLLNSVGETTASPVADITIGSSANQAYVSSPSGIFNANGYNVYAGPVGGPYYLQNSSPIALGYNFTLPSPLISGGTQPPNANTATGAGTGGSLSLQLYPAAMPGQVNIYYQARPQLWADTTVNSWTNLDTSAQEAVILFAVSRVLGNRSRGDEAKDIWIPQFDAMVEDLKSSLNRRTQPRSGVVRDVRNRTFPSAPWWMTTP